MRLEPTDSSSRPSPARRRHLLIQLFFALLVIFFFLAGWTGMRKRTIVSRGSFDGAMTTARVIQQVVDATSTYLGTITLINISLGAITAARLWLLGMPSPMMWGGIVAVLNYIPYLGPIACGAAAGCRRADDLPRHLVGDAAAGDRSSASTWSRPMSSRRCVVGHRLTINPLLILISLSFWAWVWGTTGALLAVPLLIIMKTVFAAAGKPDIAGFLFEHGTLTHVGDGDEERTSDAPPGDSGCRAVG